jgi:nifR3 family TIM-barrel protein
MAGISNLPYRRIMKSCGAGLVFSEMVSANGLIRDGAKTQQLLTTHPEESPLGIQLFGSDPQVLAEAVSRLHDAPDLIDLNMGCPVKKVVRSGSGSALLQNPGLIARILKAVRHCVSGPLTIKIRSGWDIHHMNFLEVGHIAQEEGVDAITLHPRTRCQGFAGRSNWKHIGELKRALNIPVFGSGDIMTADDGLRMYRETGCDGLMIGRGGYGNPWLIRQLNDALQGNQTTYPSAADKLAMIHRHLELHREQFGDDKTLLEMRKHISWYARGMEGASLFRSELQSCQQLPQLVGLTDHFFQRDHHQ